MAMTAKRSYMGLVAASFVLLVVWTSVTWHEHHFFERPAQYSLITLLVAGATLLGVSRTNLPLKVGRAPEKEYLKKSDEGYRAVRGTDRSDDIELLSHRRTLSSKSDDSALDKTQLRDKLVLGSLALCIAIRVGLSRKILEAPQCAANNLEKLALPIIFSVYDYTQGLAYKKTAEDERDSISNTAFEDFWDFFRWTNIRYLPLSLALSLGVYLLAPPGYISTSFCAGNWSQRNTTVLLQLLCLCLDVVIIILTWRVVDAAPDDRGRIEILGRITSASVILLCIGGIVGLVFNLGSISDTLTTSGAFKLGAIGDGLTLALALFCLSYIMKDLRPFAVVFVVTFMSIVIPLFLVVWDERKPFPPQNHGMKIFGLVLASITFLSFIVTYRASELKDAPSNILKRIHFLWYVALIGSTIFGVVAIAIRTSRVGFHPVKLMMYRANDASTRWSKSALTSTSLPVAVKEYATRYHRLPPPNFDAWYNYATLRGCEVIDDYDQIYHDLLPFWGMEPQKIRSLSVPKTAAFATIKINMNGPGVNVAGYGDTLDIVNMIKNFALWLPPMQIVIHRQADPQVSIPYSKRQSFENIARANLKKPRAPAVANWTETRSEDSWPSLPKEEHLPAPDIWSLHKSRWDTYVQPSCPLLSPARSRPWFSDKLCLNCVRPHSINQFMWNTTAALDLCHQPDLHSISNFLASPATSPSPGSQLLPIFSPRKVDGYNDILYPAPGTYVQRPAPSDRPRDPLRDYSVPDEVLKKDHADLLNSLFWLGTRPVTSGLQTNSWQHLAEQRLVQLANRNLTKNEKVPFLLPMGENEKTYLNAHVALSGIGPQLPIKANFGVSRPAGHCAKWVDCPVQDEFFNVETYDKTNKTHEESRFNHRFSLTMDTDAPHKFVQDLLSPSVAVRATIFREWYTPRLEAWLHYIPLDMRWHGLHATLAYFMGIEGVVKGREVRMRRRGSDAAAIASEGAKRVKSVMAERDAEVYMFRLLLEWGRVVDDNRESLGFVL